MATPAILPAAAQARRDTMPCAERLDRTLRGRRAHAARRTASFPSGASSRTTVRRTVRPATDSVSTATSPANSCLTRLNASGIHPRRRIDSIIQEAATGA